MNDRGRYGDNERGQYGGRTNRTVVGFTLFHTVGDRERAADQLQTELTTVVSEMLRKMGVDPSVLDADVAAMARDPAGYSKRKADQLATLRRSPLYPFWSSTVEPFRGEMRRFIESQGGWTEYVWLTNWDDYERWFARLKALRDAVEKKAGPLESLAPMPFDKNVIAEAADIAKRAAKKAVGGVEDVWNLVKYGAYAVLGIGTVVALSSVVSNLRSGKDPGEKYMELIRERRPRAPRALPEPRAQRALPPGSSEGEGA